MQSEKNTISEYVFWRYISSCTEVLTQHATFHSKDNGQTSRDTRIIWRGLILRIPSLLPMVRNRHVPYFALYLTPVRALSLPHVLLVHLTVCSVCASGYGRGASNQCHLCTARFEQAMYFVLALTALATLVVSAMLAVYLVRNWWYVPRICQTTLPSCL